MIAISELVLSVEGPLIAEVVVSEGVGSVDQEDVFVMKDEVGYTVDDLNVALEEECVIAFVFVLLVFSLWLWETCLVSSVAEDCATSLVLAPWVLWTKWFTSDVVGSTDATVEIATMTVFVTWTVLRVVGTTILTVSKLVWRVSTVGTT